MLNGQKKVTHMSFHCEEEHILTFFWNSIKDAKFEDYTVRRQAAAAGWQHLCNLLCRFPV